MSFIKSASSIKNVSAALAIMIATASSGFSQMATPVAPAAPKPPMTAPIGAPIMPAAPSVKAPVAATVAPTVATPAAKTAAPAAVTKTAPVNLNIATAEQLDGLPQIGSARAKLIIEARAKGKFKDWADFTARNVIPSNAEAAIKDKVFF